MKVGIIGAMDVEVATLKGKLQDKKTVTIARMDFCEGRLGDTPVVVVQSGIGKVNAGCCVQILADRFQVTHIINTGIAGSLNNDINIGDVVVSTKARYHDMDATVFGYQKGEVPQMGVVSFPSDPALRAAAVNAVEKTAPEIRAFEGEVLSGDQFISSQAKKNQLKEDFGDEAYCAEMEGTAIAQVSYLNHLPFVIIRAISDKADDSGEQSYDQFEKLAAVHCARITEYMVEHLGTEK